MRLAAADIGLLFDPQYYRTRVHIADGGTVVDPDRGSEEARAALAQFKEYAASTLLVLDLIGTFVFALSGGIAAARQRLDLFGVLVLSFAAATAGGIMRDLLIGAVPPAALSDWRYLGVSILAGVIVFFLFPRSERLRNLNHLVLIFDAAGLAVFAVAGILEVRLWTKSGNGRPARHVDRDRRRNAA